MRFAMNPDMVYQYPIWAVGLLLVGAAVFAAVLIELCARADRASTAAQRRGSSDLLHHRRDVRRSIGVCRHARMGRIQQGEGS